MSDVELKCQVARCPNPPIYAGVTAVESGGEVWCYCAEHLPEKKRENVLPICFANITGNLNFLRGILITKNMIYEATIVAEAIAEIRITHDHNHNWNKQHICMICGERRQFSDLERKAMKGTGSHDMIKKGYVKENNDAT